MGAINWVSGISALAIAIVTAALVCALAVFNGYVVMILQGSERVDPDLVIRPKQGSVLDLEADPRLASALAHESVARHSLVLKSRGLLRTAEHELMAEVYGVCPSYAEVVPVDSSMLEGEFLAEHGRADSLVPMVVGIGLAAEGATATSTDGTSPRLSFPRRLGMINPLAPSSAFRSVDLYAEGVLSYQTDYADRRLYLPLHHLQALLDYPASTASEIALKVAPTMSVRQAQSTLADLVGEGYEVLDRQEQQPELTFLIRAERVVVYVVMIFVLVLAAFNLASSLVMMMIEKRPDLYTLEAMGATHGQRASIFAAAGLLISLLGAGVGMVLGIAFCLVQSYFGVLVAGEGLSAMPFPIDVQGGDLLLILLATVVVSSVTTLLPSIFVGKNERSRSLGLK